MGTERGTSGRSRQAPTAAVSRRAAPPGRGCEAWKVRARLLVVRQGKRRPSGRQLPHLSCPRRARPEAIAKLTVGSILDALHPAGEEDE